MVLSPRKSEKAAPLRLDRKQFDHEEKSREHTHLITIEKSTGVERDPLYLILFLLSIKEKVTLKKRQGRDEVTCLRSQRTSEVDDEGVDGRLVGLMCTVREERREETSGS